MWKTGPKWPTTLGVPMAKKPLKFDVGLACWMRAAGIPTDVIAQQLRANEQRIRVETHLYKPFDMQAYLAFERVFYGRYTTSVAKRNRAGRSAQAVKTMIRIRQLRTEGRLEALPANRRLRA